MTSSGIMIPFYEIPAETYDLDQTMLYKTQTDELVLRVVLNLGKIQFKIPSNIISNTDQSTWEMSQEIKIKAVNDCIVKRIEIQTPALLLARHFLNGSKVSDWYPLGLPPDILLHAHIEQNFSFPNGLINA